jgi:hypothetical protein
MEESDDRVQAVEDECERQLATASEVETRHEKYINELEDERDALEVELSVQHKRSVAMHRATASTCKQLRSEAESLRQAVSSNEKTSMLELTRAVRELESKFTAAGKHAARLLAEHAVEQVVLRLEHAAALTRQVVPLPSPLGSDRQGLGFLGCRLA